MSESRSDHYILFLVNGTTYALPSRHVAHIEMVEHVTSVPNALPFVDGVVFSRGQVVPAINMRARFGFPRAALDLRSRLVVVHVHDRRVALLVDSCREFMTIPAEQVRPPGDALAATEDAHCFTGLATIADRVIVLLTLDRLLSSAEPLTAVPA
jgi:purine-binding chemotaxis protein CheW